MGDIGTHVVTAAQAGDEAARELLLTESMGLVLNLVARAADRDLDVDDVVQETMLRVVTELPKLRRADRFTPWVVSIALSRLAEARRQAARYREHTTRSPAYESLPAEATTGLDDDLRHELLRASRWLDPAYRELLSLWWLEVIGRLSRAELAAGLGQSPATVAVRVQRLRAQLETARAVVRALDDPCPVLADVVRPWDGTAEPVWRKRIARHLRTCDRCGSPGHVPAERLLALLPLLAVPAGLLRARRLSAAPSGAAVPSGVAVPSGAGGSSGAGSSSGAAGPSAVSSPSGASGPSGAGSVSVPGSSRAAVPSGAAGSALRRAAQGRPTGHGGAPNGRGGLRGGLLHRAGARTAAAAVAVAVVVGGGALYPGARDDPPETTVVTADPPPLIRSIRSPSPAPAAASAPATPAPRGAAPRSAPRATTAAPAPFFATVPALPTVTSTRNLGAVTQNARVAGRDNGQSTLYGHRSVWIFDDTTMKNPWAFLSNSGAATIDLDASDGISLTSGNPVSVKPSQTPVQLIPLTGAERRFEAGHRSAEGCSSSSDEFCGASFAFWPGPVVSDPARGRVLVFYGKLCRGGPKGTPCSGPMGKGLGTGIAAIDMSTGQVSRLSADHGPSVGSVEGRDPTMFFGATGGYSSAAVVRGGDLYAYGDCAGGCAVARVRLSDVADRAAWRFYDGSRWTSSPAAAAHLSAAGGAGQSVFYNPGLKAWMNVFLAFGHDVAQYQVGGSPFGPWSAPRELGVTVGAGNYAFYAHPEYATRNGLRQYFTYFNPSSGEQRLLRADFVVP